MAAAPRFLDILRVLAEHQVEFAPGSTYEDLASETVVYEIEGLRVRILTLAAVVRSKQHADRDKDRAVLPVLRRTLALKKSGGRE